jgi:hypothetical protein
MLVPPTAVVYHSIVLPAEVALRVVPDGRQIADAVAVIADGVAAAELVVTVVAFEEKALPLALTVQVMVYVPGAGDMVVPAPAWELILFALKELEPELILQA